MLLQPTIRDFVVAACQHYCSVVWEPACDGQYESSSRHWSVVVVVIVIVVVGCLQAELTALRSQVERAKALIAAGDTAAVRDLMQQLIASEEAAAQAAPHVPPPVEVGAAHAESIM